MYNIQCKYLLLILKCNMYTVEHICQLTSHAADSNHGSIIHDVLPLGRKGRQPPLSGHHQLP